MVVTIRGHSCLKYLILMINMCSFIRGGISVGDLEVLSLSGHCGLHLQFTEILKSLQNVSDGEKCCVVLTAEISDLPDFWNTAMFLFFPQIGGSAFRVCNVVYKSHGTLFSSWLLDTVESELRLIKQNHFCTFSLHPGNSFLYF